MIDRLRNLNIESLSFWVGFVTATVFWWLITRLRPYIKKLFVSIKEGIQTARQSLQTGAEQRLRANTLKLVQSLHLASPLFSLDEILVKPHVMAPPVIVVPGEEPPIDYVVESVIPYMPDFPELAGGYNGHAIPVDEILQGEVNLIITGKPGSGKTSALAYLTSALLRHETQVEDLENHLPIFLHISELVLPLDEETPLLQPIIDALATRSSALGQARLPEALKNAFERERALLLIDGLDEVHPDIIETLTDYISFLLEDYPATRFVVAADTYFIDGLQELDFVPVAMAAWDIRQQARFIQRWSSLWQSFVRPAKEQEEEEVYIDPLLLNGWLLGDNAALSPLEFVLKVWSAYAGDARGPKGVDAIEAYLRRMGIGISKVRPALEYLATQMVFSMRNVFTQGEAQNWTSGFDSDAVEGAGLAMVSDSDEDINPREITIPRVLSDLTRNGLLISRSNNQLSFVHPMIACYLAGNALAQAGQSDTIFSQADWPLKRYTIHYLASQSNLSDQVSRLLTDTEDPLSRGVLIVGGWLRDIPLDANWRKVILQNLANTLQQEPLPIGFRARVLACLATTNDTSIATMLRHLLRSPKSSVRHLAAVGLGFIRDTQAVGELTQLLGEASLDGQAACLALVNIGTKPALEAAASVFLHGEEPLRRAVSEAFAFHREEGHPILKEASQMDDLLVRRSAIHGLRLVGESWATDILEEMQIEEGQWVVRNAAAQVMEELNGPNPYIPRPLLPLEDTPWLVEFASEKGVGISAGDSAREMLARVLSEGDPEQTFCALELYRRRGDANIFPAIYHILYGGDQELAQAAYNTIWQLATTGAEIPSPVQFGLGY